MDSPGPAPARGLSDRDLLGDPLEFLLVDHLRQRNLCVLITQIADAPEADTSLIARVIEHIASDLTTHLIDDEEDLYPLIRRRAVPGDRVEEVLGLLSGEHAEDSRLAGEVVDGLREALREESKVLSGTLRIRLRLLAGRLRRHLAVENAIILPLAETRLTAVDRAGLSRRMAARRGINLGVDRPHG